MLLNGIDICEDLISRFLHLSNLPGNQHPSIRQEAFVSESKAAENLPDWMHSYGVDYFNRDSLTKENADLAASVPAQSPWLTGEYAAGINPGKIDPDDLILIAFNMFKDYFAAIYRDGNELRVVVMDRVDGKICWRTVYNRFEDFLTDLGI